MAFHETKHVETHPTSSLLMTWYHYFCIYMQPCLLSLPVAPSGSNNGLLHPRLEAFPKLLELTNQEVELKQSLPLKELSLWCGPSQGEMQQENPWMWCSCRKDGFNV